MLLGWVTLSWNRRVNMNEIQWVTIFRIGWVSMLGFYNLTALVAQMGDQANIVSDHSSIDVIKKHYTNKQHLVSMVRDFAVFKQ